MKEKLIGLSILITFILWSPFILKWQNPWGINFSRGMETIWANFDGPNYLIVSKTWYSKDLIAGKFSNPLPLEYYPAHWPLYPALISVFDIFLPGPVAMLVVSLLGLGFFYYIFILFLESAGVGKNKIKLLVALSLLLPARWLGVRSVGSPESWFMGFVLLSLLFYKQKKFFLAGIIGMLAQVTKSPGVLLYVSFFIYELYRILKKEGSVKELTERLLKTSPILLSILGVFWFYFLRTGDFLAYFHSGDNFHLTALPFMVFSPSGNWLGDFWKEGIIWLWLIYAIGLINVIRRKISIEAIFGVVFFMTTLFVAHRDLSRYILPIMPIAFLGFKDFVDRKTVVLILLLLFLPVLIFNWSFLVSNTSPVADWTPYL